MISVHKISSMEDLEKAFSIRKKVFVEEQQVDEEEEYDEFEQASHHYLATDESGALGTARWRITDKGCKLERFAVLAEGRNKGVGSAILKQVLQDVPRDKKIYLHAQLSAMDFYARHGFVAFGEEFTEANIRHRKMQWIAPNKLLADSQ
jgi:predicted GNAT family N-acyltransferase